MATSAALLELTDPGVRTEQQARENASVLGLGPLPQAETAEIQRAPRRLSGAPLTKGRATDHAPCRPAANETY